MIGVNSASRFVNPQIAMDDRQCDVVILGAGAAGLAAARRLSGAGLRVVVLEARDRIGGRMYTLHETGWPVPVELGAEFIHGGSAETWSIVRAAQLAAYEVSEQHLHAIDGKPQSLDFAPVWDKVFGRLDAYSGPDVSFAEFLRRQCPDASAEVCKQAVAYVEGFNAADQKLVSVRWLRESEQVGEGQSYRLQEGYDRLLTWLASGLEPATASLRLNTIARSVHWHEHAVEVDATTNTGAAVELVRARAAIITLPLGVLQAPAGAPGAVTFEPDVTETRAAWERLKMGAVVKLVLRFREAFWEQAGFADMAFLHTPSEPFMTWWTTRPVRSSVLTAWAGGPTAQRLSDRPPNELIDAALDTLARSFSLPRGDLEQLLDAWRVHDWSADPYTRGAYSYVPVAGMEAPAQLAAPVAETLFFAGEATDARLNGTVAGAIASGHRAAEEVLRARHELVSDTC